MDASLVTKGCIIVAAAIIGVGIYIYLNKLYSKDSFVKVAAPPTRAAPDKRAAPTLVFFYADWCPACEAMLSEWVATEQALLGKVETKAIESANPEMSRFTIQGFPTIRFYPIGLDADTYLDYKGPRKAEQLVEFAIGPQ